LIRTVLFDLDGTLLPLDIDTFIRKYFRLLTVKVTAVLPIDNLADRVMRSTMVMINSLDPAKTNQQVFQEDFLADIGHPPETVLSLIDQFYEKDFSSLQDGVPASEHARAAVEGAVRHGCEVVVATNPIFPERAIRERLRWAGVDGFDYRLVTTYENMHFCKPRIEYYQEILEKIVRSPGDCLMVGNDVEEDLIASQLGIRTFLVTDLLLNPRQREYSTDYEGTLADLARFLREELPKI
jgi:FMN phosphatase YigB (HAD superfamily)